MRTSQASSNGQQPVTTGNVVAAGYGMLGGHLAWGFQLLAAYWLVQPVCVTGGIVWLHVVSAIALMVSAGAFLVSLATWRRTGVPFGWGLDGANGWLSFAAVFGMASGLLFSTGIVAAWIAVTVLDPCSIVFG